MALLRAVLSKRVQENQVDAIDIEQARSDALDVILEIGLPGELSSKGRKSMKWTGDGEKIRHLKRRLTRFNANDEAWKG